MKIGTNSIISCKVGTNNVQKIYLGTNLVYEASPTPASSNVEIYNQSGFKIKTGYNYNLEYYDDSTGEMVIEPATLASDLTITDYRQSQGGFDTTISYTPPDNTEQYTGMDLETGALQYGNATVLDEDGNTITAYYAEFTRQLTDNSKYNAVSLSTASCNYFRLIFTGFTPNTSYKLKYGELLPSGAFRDDGSSGRVYYYYVSNGDISTFRYTCNNGFYGYALNPSEGNVDAVADSQGRIAVLVKVPKTKVTNYYLNSTTYSKPQCFYKQLSYAGQDYYLRLSAYKNPDTSVNFSINLSSTQPTGQLEDYRISINSSNESVIDSITKI